MKIKHRWRRPNRANLCTGVIFRFLVFCQHELLFSLSTYRTQSCTIRYVCMPTSWQKPKYACVFFRFARSFVRLHFSLSLAIFYRLSPSLLCAPNKSVKHQVTLSIDVRMRRARILFHDVKQAFEDEKNGREIDNLSFLFSFFAWLQANKWKRPVSNATIFRTIMVL